MAIRLQLGTNIPFQRTRKASTGKHHELPGKTALAELKEVGDLIVTSTQKELPVKEALLESNEYGNCETEYVSGTVPTLPTSDKPPELVSSDDDDEPGDDQHRRKSIEELLQFIKERSYDPFQPGPPVTKLAGMESSVGTHIDKSKTFNTVKGFWKCMTWMAIPVDVPTGKYVPEQLITWQEFG